MELAYQGLFIRLPFEGAVGVEAFEMNASFNDHVTLRLLLLVEEEKIEAPIPWYKKLLPAAKGAGCDPAPF